MSNFESLSNRYRNFLTGSSNPPFKRMSDSKLNFVDETQLTISEEKDDSKDKEVYLDKPQSNSNIYKILILVSITMGVIGLGYLIKRMTEKPREDNTNSINEEKKKGLPSNVIADLSSSKEEHNLNESSNSKKQKSLNKGQTLIKKKNIMKNVKSIDQSLSKEDIFKNNIESVKQFIRQNKKYLPFTR